MGFARDFFGHAVKDVVLGHELPALYRRAVEGAPVDERKALFINGKLDTMPDAFELIFPYVGQRYGLDARFIGLNQTNTGFSAYHKRCRALIEDIATAKYVFLEDASDVVSCLPLRPETKVIQLWHACGAFKKWGMSTAELKFGNTAKNIKRHPFYGNLSLVSVSSPEVIWAYREAMMLEDRPEIVKALGVSRTDVFFDEERRRSAREWLQKRFPGVAGRKVIFYAPTFRGTTKSAKGPDALDLLQMKQALGDDYALLIKHHPFVAKKPPIDKDCADFAFECDSADPTDRLMMCADVLITDYSSVIFEYSLLGRPMVFFAYDLDDYEGWRGFYYDYHELTPGPVVQSTDEIVSYVESLAAHFDDAEVVRFREKFMSACDGHATERICREVIGNAHA